MSRDKVLYRKAWIEKLILMDKVSLDKVKKDTNSKLDISDFLFLVRTFDRCDQLSHALFYTSDVRAIIELLLDNSRNIKAACIYDIQQSRLEIALGFGVFDISNQYDEIMCILLNRFKGEDSMIDKLYNLQEDLVDIAMSMVNSNGTMALRALTHYQIRLEMEK